uniref:ORF13 n=1 Tax=Malaco herpesvirus 1 TaxID=3031797 RepID=A0AA48P7R0_9VIRU|nr:TPA_asm: ORF13 [Malaco herpesvirus 1]
METTRYSTDLWLPSNSVTEPEVCLGTESVEEDLRIKFPKVNIDSDDVGNTQLTTFCLALNVTKNQDLVMRHMLAASNLAFNWCRWLVYEKNIKVDKGGKTFIQSIVTKKDLRAVPDQSMIPDFVREHEELLKGTTSIRVTANCTFLTNWKTCMTLHKGNISKFNIDYKKIDDIISDTFKVQRLYIDKCNSKDEKKCNLLSKFQEKCEKRLKRKPVNGKDFTLDRYIKFCPKLFPSDEYCIRIAKYRNIARMPPFVASETKSGVAKRPMLEHDCSFTLRPNGMWVMNIPCDPKYTRREVNQEEIDQRKPVIALDPGVRTFQTGYDPVGKQIIEIGKRSDINIIKLDKLKKRGRKTDG